MRSRRAGARPVSPSASSARTRPEGDGLEIHARLVPGRDDGLVATTWVAREARPEIVWAAIDCPGAYAVQSGARGEPVLARMTARLERLPVEGERCVVAGWPIERDGRKLHAGTALYGEDGAAIAVSRQLWIEPRVETPTSGSRRGSAE